MAFPDLTPVTGGSLTAVGTGTPVNGPNTFAHGLSPSLFDADAENFIEIDVTALGPSVTGASFGSLSADKTHVTVNFTQTGADQATLRLKLVHSLAR